MQKLKNFTAASLLGMSTLLPLQAVFAEETAAVERTLAALEKRLETLEGK